MAQGEILAAQKRVSGGLPWHQASGPRKHAHRDSNRSGRRTARWHGEAGGNVGGVGDYPRTRKTRRIRPWLDGGGSSACRRPTTPRGWGHTPAANKHPAIFCCPDELQPFIFIRSAASSMRRGHWGPACHAPGRACLHKESSRGAGASVPATFPQPVYSKAPESTRGEEVSLGTTPEPLFDHAESADQVLQCRDPSRRKLMTSKSKE